MLKKTICFRVNLIVAYAVAAVAFIAVMLWLTNGVQNLRFVLLRPEQIESVTVFQTTGDRQATLSPEDAAVLAEALRHVIVEGISVRLMEAEDFNPQFRVQLKNGHSFDISCYSQHYILNGRGYDAKNTELTYRKIFDLYQSCNNRSYFPEEEVA